MGRSERGLKAKCFTRPVLEFDFWPVPTLIQVRLRRESAPPRLCGRGHKHGILKGAVPAVYSSSIRFRSAYGPGNAEFAAHIGLYTPCNVTYKQDDKVAHKPIRLFHGIADDYVSIEPCRTYVRRLKEAGADVTLTEYPDALHAYDNFTRAGSVAVPGAQTTRNCLIVEGDGGVLLNGKTGQAYSLGDACVEKGPHVGYNEAAHKATVDAVKQFLTTQFRLASQ